MGNAHLWIMIMVFLTSSVASQQNQRSLQDLNLSAFELALIRAIASEPADGNIVRGNQEWNKVRSVSGESQATQRERDIIRRVGDAIPGDTNGGGGDADWTIVKSVSSELDGSQFQDPNPMEPLPPGFSGGSIDVPLLDPVPMQCPDGFRFVAKRCRMAVR